MPGISTIVGYATVHKTYAYTLQLVVVVSFLPSYYPASYLSALVLA